MAIIYLFQINYLEINLDSKWVSENAHIQNWLANLKSAEIQKRLSRGYVHLLNRINGERLLNRINGVRLLNRINGCIC